MILITTAFTTNALHSFHLYFLHTFALTACSNFALLIHTSMYCIIVQIFKISNVHLLNISKKVTTTTCVTLGGFVYFFIPFCIPSYYLCIIICMYVFISTCSCYADYIAMSNLHFEVHRQIQTNTHLYYNKQNSNCQFADKQKATQSESGDL